MYDMNIKNDGVTPETAGKRIDQVRSFRGNSPKRKEARPRLKRKQTTEYGFS